MQGILSALEKQLLKIADGEKQVEEIKRNLFLVSRDRYTVIIEDTLNAKVKEFITKTSIKKQ